MLWYWEVFCGADCRYQAIFYFENFQNFAIRSIRDTNLKKSRVLLKKIGTVVTLETTGDQKEIFMMLQIFILKVTKFQSPTPNKAF